MKYLLRDSPFDDAPSEVLLAFFLGMMPGSVMLAARRKPQLSKQVIAKAMLTHGIVVSSVKSPSSLPYSFLFSQLSRLLLT